MGAQKPIHGPHKDKVDSDETGEELFEPPFDLGVYRKIYKVINVQANGEWSGRDVCGGIVGVADGACEHARIRGIGFEADAGEDWLNLVVPVLGTAVEAVQSFLKEPIFIFASVGVSNGWFHDSGFVVGKNALTKCIFAVTLLVGAALLHGKTDHQPHGVGSEDGGILFWLGPNVIFIIAKDHDARFGAERVEYLVFLDREHTHSGDPGITVKNHPTLTGQDTRDLEKSQSVSHQSSPCQFRQMVARQLKLREGLIKPGLWRMRT
jgi:hypothetical protein